MGRAAGDRGRLSAAGRPPLAGLRVVELTAYVAAPLACATLAALGADVVRVEPPGGATDRTRWPLHEGTSLYWAGLNQGKRSVSIDMGREAGRRLVTDLIVDAGIVVTNLGEPDWLAFEHLRERREDLIMAVLRGNPDGTAAVDYTVNAASGFAYLNGPEDHDGPINHALPAWDALAAQMLAVGLVAAELHRTRTGEGQLLRLSLSDVAFTTAVNLGYVAEAEFGGVRPRLGNYVFGTYVCDFRTADGRDVLVAAVSGGQWRRLVEATGTAAEIERLEREEGIDLTDEGDRFFARKQISAILAPFFARLTREEVGEELERHGVLWGGFQTFAELLDDPRCSERNPIFAQIDEPGVGSFLHATSPLDFGGSPRLPPRPFPRVGEHGREVLSSWLDLDAEALDRLVDEGALAGIDS